MEIAGGRVGVGGGGERAHFRREVGAAGNFCIWAINYPCVLFVSPAKQKRDICTAFPVSSLSLSSSAASTFLSLGHFLGNYKG